MTVELLDSQFCQICDQLNPYCIKRSASDLNSRSEVRNNKIINVTSPVMYDVVDRDEAAL